jgi:hypothetical protein
VIDKDHDIREAAFKALALEPLAAAYAVHAMRIGIDRETVMQMAGEAFDNATEELERMVKALQEQLAAKVPR